jgi:Domain of unknown function (DUF5047)
MESRTYSGTARSARFDAAVTDGHERTVRVEVLTGPQAAPVDISEFFTGGSLDVSRQQVRRSGQFTFTDDGTSTVTVTSQGDLLSPYGNELRVWSGIRYWDGTEELLPVGTLRITGATMRYPTTTVEVSDRAWVVAGAKLEAPYQIAKGQDYDAAMAELLLLRYPAAVFDFPNVAATTPLLNFDTGTDPWDELQKMAAAVGFGLAFDVLGMCRLLGEQNVDSPVWTYDGGPADLPYHRDDPAWSNLALYDMQRALRTDDAYNVAIVTGESTSNAAPALGVARDLDPTSPTYYNGKFGIRVADPVSSPRVTSAAQAGAAARRRLQGLIGLGESLTMPAVPHPGLDVDDAIIVIRNELGINTVHVLDQFPLPLRAADGAQTLATRVRRLVLDS